MEDEQEYDPGYGMEDEDDDEITQEDAWAVISAYFEDKGLVRQQLDSFDEFIQNTMQEIVDESADIEIRPESQHNPGHQPDFAEVRFFPPRRRRREEAPLCSVRIERELFLFARFFFFFVSIRPWEGFRSVRVG